MARIRAQSARSPSLSPLAALVVLAALAVTGAIDCTPIYPVDSSSLIFDFDINCHLNSSLTVHTNWTSKVNGYSADPQLSLPLSAVAADTTRGTALGSLFSGRKLTIPVDISPNKYPALTLEVLVSTVWGVDYLRARPRIL